MGFQRRHIGLDHHKRFKIEDALDVAQRHIEQQTNARGQ
jgi:low affinity Fe/Cu permease